MFYMYSVCVIIYANKDYYYYYREVSVNVPNKIIMLLMTLHNFFLIWSLFLSSVYSLIFDISHVDQ